MAVINQGDRPSFFATQREQDTSLDLLSAQTDPTQPQAEGVSLVSDPLVADRWVRSRLPNFDPEIFDLRDSSHLMRLMKALLGAAGVGGARKQATLRRMSLALNGTHFLELDSFWGAIFSIGRLTPEKIPFDPLTASADLDTWDDVHNRDGGYRSRLSAFAKAVNQGATHQGLIAAAEALLGVEVDLIELWNLTDIYLSASNNDNTWLAVQSRFPRYSDTVGFSWNQLMGGVQTPGQVPLGGRGEIILKPKTAITQEQKQHVLGVLDNLKPAHSLLTIKDTGIEAYRQMPVRGVWADSEDWTVTSTVSPRGDLLNADAIYPNQGQFQAARPAMSRYSGQSWGYASRIAQVTAYQMVGGVLADPNPDVETVVYLDGQSHAYVAKDAVLTVAQEQAARNASEGILTAPPYVRAS